MTPARRTTASRTAYLVCATIAIATAGCFNKPNGANITLRKQIQTLEEQVAMLSRGHAADQAEIASLRGGTTVPTLPGDRIDRLFTVAGIQINRLTGGADLDAAHPGSEGVKVYVVPVDATGDTLKAAGSFTVELFDLSAESPRIGQWTFDVDQAKASWRSSALLQSYVLMCPWQTLPAQNKLVVRVKFVDELTGRSFNAVREITVAVNPTVKQSNGR